MTIRISPVAHKAALYAVTHWHYSKTLPVPPMNTLGVWEDDRFIGCVVFSRGNAPHMGERWQLTQGEMCELTRVALDRHTAPVSQVVAEALRWLKTHNPAMRLVVSFADPGEGHHGGIYQAGNWFYVGTSAPTVLYKDAAGRIWHSRQVSSSGLKTQFGTIRRVASTKDCTTISQPGKHRYLMPLDKSMRRRVAKHALAFPPAVEVSTVTRSDSVEEMPVQLRPTALAQTRGRRG